MIDVTIDLTHYQIAKGLAEGGIMSQAKNFYANVSTAIRRLDERGEVVQLPDTKQWGLSDWYPGRPRPARKSEKEPASAVPAPEADGAGKGEPTMKVA